MQNIYKYLQFSPNFGSHMQFLFPIFIVLQKGLLSF